MTREEERHFEMANVVTLYDFSAALDIVKAGRKISRAAWIDTFAPTMAEAYPFAVIMTPLSLPPFNTQGTDRKVNDRTAKYIGEDRPLLSKAYFAYYTPRSNAWQPGWLPGIADILADDWFTMSVEPNSKETAKLEKMLELARRP